MAIRRYPLYELPLLLLLSIFLFKTPSNRNKGGSPAALDNNMKRASHVSLIFFLMFSISSRNSLFSFIFSSTFVTEYMMVV